MTYQICLLPGDGIGPEVIDCAEQVLGSLPLALSFTRAEIGYAAYQRLGSPLPLATLQAIRTADATLFGAVTTPPNIAGYFSPVVRMRQELDLYANLRPCRSIAHPSSRPGIDMLIVRENTEGLYSGIERVEEDGNRAADPNALYAKLLNWPARPGVKVCILSTKPMFCARPAACSARWPLKSPASILISRRWSCWWMPAQWRLCAHPNNSK